MHTKIQKFNAVLASGIITLSFGSLILSSVSTQAVFNPSSSRYEDSLSAATKEAVYNYNYENTSAEDAPGYFELAFEKLSGAEVKDLIEVKSITEVSPIDYESKNALDNASTTEYNLNDAIYTDADGQLKIRISPQSECKVRPEGGCADGMIPAAKPARISIKIALKDGAPSDSSLIFGTGRIYFPNGYDVNALGWKINVNQADEAGISVPAIKDEIVDQAALELNQSLQQSNTTVAETDSSKLNDVALNPAQTVNNTFANLDNIENQKAETGVLSTDSSNQNIVLVVIGIVGAAVLAGVALFFVNKSNKAKK